MVLRTITVYSVVCALLLCPYPCLSQAANICCVEAGKDRDCQAENPCCPTTSTETGNNLPGNNGCCTQIGTCLCHGAILEHSQSPADLHSGLVTFLPIDAMQSVSESLASDGSALLKERMACHFPAVESGRTLRALIASFLL